MEIGISLDAVVLAGGINTRELYPGYEPGYKALIEIHGKPLISYVLDALHGSSRINRVGIVGPESDLRPIVGPEYAISAPGDSLLGSVLVALSMFPESPMVALVTADLPLLRAEMVDEFIDACGRQRSDFADNLYLSVVPREHFTGEFAACAKNMNVFRDISICHGNLSLISPSLVRNDKAMSRLNALYAKRKSPIASAMAIGPKLGLAYIFGVHFFHLWRIDQLARMASNTFNLGLTPVVCPHPEVAVDVDEPADYQLVTAIFERDR